MATRKKAATVTEEPPATDVDKQVIEWATPGTMTERGFIPPLSGNLIWADIDLYPELEDFRAGFRLDIAWRVISGGEDAPGNTPMEKRCRRLSLIIPDFEGWQLLDPLTQQPIPQPDPSDWRTYECIAWWTGPLKGLGDWLMTAGWAKAVEAALPNSKRALTKPTSSTRREKSTSATGAPEKSVSDAPSEGPSSAPAA